MQNIENITSFFGWMTIINFGFLIFSSVMLVMLKDFVTNIHSKMFGISKDNLNQIYFRFLANFKTLVIIFSLVPYIALKIMA